jgi:hypothetical protein
MRIAPCLALRRHVPLSKCYALGIAHLNRGFRGVLGLISLWIYESDRPLSLSDDEHKCADAAMFAMDFCQSSKVSVDLRPWRTSAFHFDDELRRWHVPLLVRLVGYNEVCARPSGQQVCFWFAFK